MMQRLKICIDAARGLSYLHDPQGSQQRVLHLDIKSSNILLDESWNAKISDMGLSKYGPANQQHTFVVSDAVGTFWYVDPLYRHLGMLTKESDVYSFGVVLFEVLCGKLCYEEVNGKFESLVHFWKESYEQKRLDEIIFKDLLQQMDSRSLEEFSNIAFQCLNESHEQRPTMTHILKSLEIALQCQEIHERVKLPNDYKEMLETEVVPLEYRSQSELKMHLLKGIFLNGGKTWFSINMNGEHCKMISIAECLTSTASESQKYIPSSELNSRFAVGCFEPSGQRFKLHVKTQFLTPLITYTVNLVFKNKKPNKQYIGLEHELKGKTSYSFLSDEREDGWLTAELYHLITSDGKTVDLEIELNTKHCPTLLVEGIEFQPLEKVEQEVLMDEDEMQPISDTHAYWEQKLPNDYENMIKLSTEGLRWKTKEEIYHILRNGLLTNDGEKWLFVAKNGKKCLMLPAREALEEDKWDWKSVPSTRFEEVDDCIFSKFEIFCKFRSKMLSPQTTYATYLVYKLQEGYESVKPYPVQVKDESLFDAEPWHVFLSTPQTPIIRCNGKVTVEKKTENPMHRPNIKGLPRHRTDGWMEVQVSEFRTINIFKMTLTRLKFSSYDMSLKGITVLGVEYRPI